MPKSPEEARLYEVPPVESWTNQETGLPTVLDGTMPQRESLNTVDYLPPALNTNPVSQRCFSGATVPNS